MVKTGVNLCGTELKCPVIPASGTFGYGYEYAELYDLNILGSISFKGTTENERFGNPTPRIAECPAGILNAVGLQNPGIDRVISEELPKLRQCFNGPIIANIGGFSVDEFVRSAVRFDAEEQVEILEINVSCPNLSGNGGNFGTDAKKAAEVTRAVKEATTKPVFMKLTPNVTDIASIAKACEEAGADGISMINTMFGMRIDLRSRRPVLANKMGGYSGPSVFPVALRMVYQVYEAVKIPIMGIGGVSSAEDVIEMMLAGAAAVQVGAANCVNPWACRDIVEALPDAMEKYGIVDLSKITGEAHNG